MSTEVIVPVGGRGTGFASRNLLVLDSNGTLELLGFAQDYSADKYRERKPAGAYEHLITLKPKSRKAAAPKAEPKAQPKVEGEAAVMLKNLDDWAIYQETSTGRFRRIVVLDNGKRRNQYCENPNK